MIMKICNRDAKSRLYNARSHGLLAETRPPPISPPQQAARQAFLTNKAMREKASTDITEKQPAGPHGRLKGHHGRETMHTSEQPRKNAGFPNEINI